MIEGTRSVLRAELERAETLSDYEAVDVLWVTLLKAANTFHESSEHRRVERLVEDLPGADLAAVLVLPAVDVLLDLDPPLETVLSDQQERLHAEATLEAIHRLRTLRRTEPREAAKALGEILKRIRNKRAHGFKDRTDPRDAEILSAARQVLLALCRLSLRL
jgi:hypothetical protein